MPPSILTIDIHESEFPAAARERSNSALRSGKIPGKLLFHSPEQARRWQEYHQAWSPSASDGPLKELYRQSYLAAITELKGGGVHLVGLGCGGGEKEAALLEELAKSNSGGEGISYTPIDVAPPLVLQSALAALRGNPGLAVRPLVADLATYPAGASLLPAGALDGAPRLFTCFGMTPNFHHEEFPRYLRRLLGPGDLLLLSANLSPRGFPAGGESILPQYDNPPAHHWYAGALESLGCPPSRMELTVRGQGLAEDGSIWRVAVEARPRDEITISPFGEPISLKKGEPLELFHSNRFTERAFKRTLTLAGLECLQSRLNDSGEEGIYLCRGSTNSPNGSPE